MTPPCYRWLPLWATCIFLFSCSHYNYSPGSVVTPFLDKKNAVGFSANFGLILADNLVEAQLAYNPFRRVTIAGGYSLISSKFSTTMGMESYRVECGDFMIGAWSPHYLDVLQLGLFAGYSAGEAQNSFRYNNSSFIRFQKPYLQPSFRLIMQHFRFGMGFRFSRLSFGKGSIDLVSPVEYVNWVRNIEADSPLNILESGLNFAMYSQPLTFTLGMVTTRAIPYKTIGETYGFDRSNITMGFQIDINDLGKRMRKKKPRPVDQTH